MKKVVLIDNLYNDSLSASHNRTYADSLLSIVGTALHKEYKPFQYNSKSQYLNGLRERKQYIERISTNVDVFHFLVLDHLYRYPMLFRKLKKNEITLIGTLHHVPNSYISQFMLKKTARQLDVIVVHSNYLQSFLKTIGISNVVSINYPAFVKCEPKFMHLDIPDDKYKVLLLGGTRKDKGADLAIDAAKLLSEEDKEKTIFIFAGVEESVKYKYIKEVANKNKINIIIDDRVLPDPDYWGYIKSSDFILLPYRRSFSGASGPLTDGAYMGKPILGPSSGNLGYTIKENNLGITFEPENIEAIAEAVHLVISKGFILSSSAEQFKRSLDENYFLERYSDLYQRTGSHI